MKFVRGLAVASWVSVPLAIACGSAGSDDLFSPSGGETSVDRAGASGVAAAASFAGADTAGMSAGGTSEGGASAGERGVAGKGSAGATEPGGGRAGGGAGAGGKGQGGAPNGGAGATARSGGASVGAGGASAGAGGGVAGGATGGTGGIVGSSGGASGAGNGEGCPVNGAPMPGAPCQVTTPDSCFYSGVACSCQQSGPSEFGRKWACYGTPDKCPNDAPAPDSGPCKNGAECPYPDGDFCVCAGGGGGDARYSCQPAKSACPDMKPFKGTGCQLPVRSCAYADDQCFCDGDNWTCESN